MKNALPYKKQGRASVGLAGLEPGEITIKKVKEEEED